jgi:hypothetical protein
MRITSKGRVTIPANIRPQAGLLPNTEVEQWFTWSSETLSFYAQSNILVINPIIYSENK